MAVGDRFPRAILHLDGLAIFGLSLVLYAELGKSWWLYLALFLVPDVACLGYLGGRAVGAISYNIAHSYALPAGVFALGLGASDPLLRSIGLIWIGHIAFDRALGFGLKYPESFKETHIQKAGP